MTEEFQITVMTEMGIHFRPAERIVAAGEETDVTVRLFNPVFGPSHPGACTFLGYTLLRILKGSTIKVRLEGKTPEAISTCKKLIHEILS